jgi:hypothetical protein
LPIFSNSFRQYKGKSTFEDHTNLLQHHDRYFRIPLGNLRDPGNYKWLIRSVTDAFNLTTTYDPTSTDNHTEVSEMNVEVFAKPVASLGASTFLIAENKTATIPVIFTGSPPFSVVVQQPRLGGGYIEETFTRDSGFSLTAGAQGVYRLVSVHDGSVFSFPFN